MTQKHADDQFQEIKLKRTLHKILFVIIILLTSGCATVSTSGNYTLRSGNTLQGNLIITSGTATIEESSHVAGSIIMTSGKLIIHGEVDGDIVLSSGKVTLGPTAIVHGGIMGTSDEISQADGSQVDGQILEQSSFTIGFFQIFGSLFSCCLLPLLFLGLLIFFLLRRKPVTSVAPPSQDKAPTSAPVTPEDPKQRLTRLKEMLDEDLITEDEFESKKTEILAGM